MIEEEMQSYGEKASWHLLQAKIKMHEGRREAYKMGDTLKRIGHLAIEMKAKTTPQAFQAWIESEGIEDAITVGIEIAEKRLTVAKFVSRLVHPFTIRGMLERIAEANKARLPTREEWVYIARTDTEVKIGFSSNVAQRIKGLKSPSGKRPQLVGCFNATRAFERRLLDHHAAHRIEGEWFHAVPAVLDHAAQLIKQYG